MSFPIDSVVLKLARADEHLHSLQAEVRTYLLEQPYAVVLEAKQDYVAFVFRLRSVPPARLSIIVGDCLYNIRSALDHLAQLLHVANGGLITDTRPCFPIFADEAEFKKGSSGLRAIEKMRPDIRDFIIHQQPYFGRDVADAKKHALWRLHELNNADKHRRLTLTTAATESMAATFNTGDGPGVTDVRHVSGGTFREGDELAAFNMTINEAVRKGVEIKPELSTFVTLQETGLESRPVIDVIATLITGVRDRIIQPILALQP